MTVGDLMKILARKPLEAEIVVDERDLRGGYLWDITAIFGPDEEDTHNETKVMIRCTEVCRHADS